MKKAGFILFVLVLFVIVFTVFRSSAQSPLKVGDKIPSFTLLDQSGQTFDIFILRMTRRGAQKRLAVLEIPMNRLPIKI